MVEPTKTEIRNLIDEVRRQTTNIEGQMDEADWSGAAVHAKALGKALVELNEMIGQGYDATRNAG